MIGFCAGLCWRMPRACARVIGCFAPCVVEDCTCICVVSCFAHQWLGLIYLHCISVFHSFSFSLFLSLMPLACGFIHFTSLRSAKGGCDCPCSFDGLAVFGFFFFFFFFDLCLRCLPVCIEECTALSFLPFVVPSVLFLVFIVPNHR